MAQSRKKQSSPSDSTVALDYRYPNATRKNIPPAGLAAQGTIRKEQKHKYSYNPHLPPVLRFDPTGNADALPELIQAATTRALTEDEARQLADALRNQQPWLEWSGKREEQDCVVDPVALHIHERISTQAILKVAERQDVQRSLFADPQQDLRDALRFYEHDVDWSNRMILGDSLAVMASLSRREALAGKVQMIYIDPPYGIKYSSNFQSEISNRVVTDKDEDLTREPEMIKAYRDTWTLGVHSYLAYMRDRLYAAKELLTDSGSVFIQISDDNVHRVRAVMDEVFGYENAVATIAYQKASPVTTKIRNGFNYVLWFSKNASLVKVRKLSRSRSLSDGSTEDPKKLALWLQYPSGFERTLTTEEKRGETPIPADAIVFRADKVRDSGINPEKASPLEFGAELLSPGKGFSWRGYPEEMRRLSGAERIVRTSETLAFKLFMNDSAGVELTSFWIDTAGKIPDMRYVVQTNDKIIERCMLMTTDPGDLVLDPTCGSGTTAYVAEQWGRRWITIDTSRVALAIARQRLLTAKFDYYSLRPTSAEDVSRNPHGAWLHDPTNEIESSATFDCKTVPHVTLKSIAQNQALDGIFDKWQPVLNARLKELNTALAAANTPALRTSLKAKLEVKIKMGGGVNGQSRMRMSAGG